MKNKYDVIIIGAGIGGLMCGSYLAKAGLKILILEKNKNAGGCASSIKQDGFTFDMGAHLIGAYNTHGLLRHYLRNIEIDLDLIRLNPSDRFTFNGESIDVPEELNEYIDVLQKRFPTERKNIEVFFDALIKIYRCYLLRKNTLQKYVKLTYQDLLDEFIGNKKLQGILSGQCPYVGLPPSCVSVIAMSFMMISYLRDGTYYAKGGTQNLAEALCAKIAEYSGDILYNTKIKKISLEKNNAKYVVADNGNTFEGLFIISNASAETTFLNMVGSDKLESSFTKKLNKMKIGLSYLIFNLGINIDSARLAHVSGWHYKDYDLNKSFTEGFYIFIPTLYDRSLAPDGFTVLQWRQVVSFQKKQDWNKEKKEIEPKLVEMIEKVAGLKLRSKIAQSILATPKDIESFTGNTAGSIYGWEMSPQNMAENRLNSVTPVNNLFLAGHWTNPGCGIVGVATSGVEVAKTILKKRELIMEKT